MIKEDGPSKENCPKVDNFGIHHSLLDTIFEKSPANLALFRGPDFIIERVNFKFQSYYCHLNFLGKPLLEAFPELEKQEFPALMKRVWTTGEPYTGKETLTYLQLEEGKPCQKRYFNFTYSRTYDQQGKPYGIFLHSIDVTDEVVARKQLEEGQLALKESQEKLQKFHEQLRDFFTQAPQPMGIIEGPEYRFVLVNAPYEHFVGRKLLGKTVNEAFGQEEINHFLPILEKVYQTGKSYVGKELPVTILDKDGIYRDKFLNYGVSAYRSVSGEVRGAMVIMQDVTEEVKGRQEAELQKEWFRLLIMSIPVPVIVTHGPDHQVEIANEAYLELVGKNSIDMIKGLKIAHALPKMAPLILPTLNEVYQTGKPILKKEMVLTLNRTRNRQARGQGHGNGNGHNEPSYFNLDWHPLTGIDGKTYGVLGTWIDITDVVLSKKAKESELARKMARTLAEAVKAREQRDLYLVEARQFRIQRDIYQAENQAEKALLFEAQELNKKLKEEREVRERFVETLTHDLRTPLAAAKLLAQGLTKKTGLPEDVRKSADKIFNCTDRMDFMIRDLLDANRIKAGEGFPIKVKDCDLQKVVLNAISELSTIHGSRLQTFFPQESVMGKWDALAMERVVQNLVDNGIKYGLKDGVVTIGLKVKTSEDLTPIAELSVHNLGKEIPESDQKTLFNPYRRGGSMACDPQKGWGIGLTLVKGIAEAHGGSVKVQSEKLMGTKFMVILPIVPTES